MRVRPVAITALVLVVVVTAGAFIAWPRGATPVTEQEALADYRARATGPETPGTHAARPATEPAPGVYTYASTGQEVVKLGVLPAETRSYPDTMTVIIVSDEPSCFTTTINLIDQHTEDTTYCTDGPGRFRIAAHHKHQQIGALSPSATMTCEPNLLVGGADENALTCTLTLSGGPAQLTATLNGTAKVTDPASITVGGHQVEAIAVDVAYQISGDLTGTWHEQTWFARGNWLPLRIERNLDLHGLATFTEQSTLELTDTSPTR